MIIQPSDFAVSNTRFLIPNITAGPGQWTMFIDEREAYILRVVFGSEFYQDFVDALAALPAAWVVTTAYTTATQVSYSGSSWTALANSLGVIPVEGASWTKGADDKWLKLRDGGTYEYNGKTYRYSGLKDILIPYIFSEYVKKNHVNVAKLGVNQPKVDNSVVVDPIHVIVSAYNEFVRLLGKSYYGVQSMNTFYGFYWANRTVDYTDLSFDSECEILPINSFGI
jgi:hypothetical protein